MGALPRSALGRVIPHVLSRCLESVCTCLPSRQFAFFRTTFLNYPRLGSLFPENEFADQCSAISHARPAQKERLRLIPSFSPITFASFGYCNSTRLLSPTLNYNGQQCPRDFYSYLKQMWWFRMYIFCFFRFWSFFSLGDPSVPVSRSPRGFSFSHPLQDKHVGSLISFCSAGPPDR